LWWILTPEFYWQTWTADGVLPLGGTDRLPVMLAAGLILAWGGVLGWSALAIVGASRHLSRTEQFVFGEGVGLHLLSLLTLAAGLAGWLSRPVVWIGTGGALTALLLAFALWKRKQSDEDAGNNTSLSSAAKIATRPCRPNRSPRRGWHWGRQCS
jgi:hypothetical protein